MGHQLTFPFARHIVLFSKGHSSALVATEVVRRYGPDDVHPAAADGAVRLVARAVTALDAVHHAARRGEP